MRFLKTEDEPRNQIGALEDRLARDADPARRWEYYVLRVGPKARAEHQLNELGTKGWQLVQAIEAGARCLLSRAGAPLARVGRHCDRTDCF